MADSAALTQALLQKATARDEIIHAAKNQGEFDLVIVGGGIHGAASARLAAAHGLKTLLLEKGDYAGETSSRSSKMAHGGLRYLEMFDFKQVFEGIKAREDLFSSASHNVRPERFLIPVFKKPLFFGWKLKVGLTLYDLFVKEPSRAHRWIPSSKLTSNSFTAETPDLTGCFEYCDGLMDDTRLVIDNIVDARLRGALCLNHAMVTTVVKSSSGSVEVGVKDRLADSTFSVSAKLVLNCAGPWAPFIGKENADLDYRTEKVRYSQGSHLLFNKKWTDPSLFLPLDEPGRYYFVWPHPEGTLVGTTEREVEKPVGHPLPLRDEVDEILGRLKKDIPHMELNRDTLHYAFAGVRTLPVREGGGKTSELSRKHIWSHDGGMLTLYGGKYTTAYWTSYEGVAQACEILGKPKPKTLDGVKLEGTALLSQVDGFRATLRSRGVSDVLIERSINRFGGSVVHLLADEAFLQPIGDTILSGELYYALRVEQAETLDDIYRRRLSLEFRPDHGLPIIDAVTEIGSRERPGYNWQRDIAEYDERLEKLNEIMQVPLSPQPQVKYATS